MAGHINRDKRQTNFDYKELLRQREEKEKYKKKQQNPFLISQPHADPGLYEDLYKFNVKKELKEYLEPLEVHRPEKKKLTKFDILMLNPRSLPRKVFPVKKSTHQMVQNNEYEQEEYIEDEERDRDSRQGEFEGRRMQDEPLDYNKVVEELWEAKDRLKLEKIQNADFENDKVKEHILKLKTGEEAIMFFAKYGNSTPIKFLNCYPDPDNLKRPYDLLIEHDIEKVPKFDQYYTVSPTGIVRIYNTFTNKFDKHGKRIAGNNEDTTEFISLSDWMKESTQFNIVSNIHFFKWFTLIKLFTFWRSNTKYKKYIKLREQLVKKVFTCKPVFVDKVMEINQELQDINKHAMVSFNEYTNKQIIADDFMNNQKTIRSKAHTAMVSIYEKIVLIINATIEKLKDNKNEKMTSELEKINFGKQIKQKAIYLKKLEQQVKKERDRLAKEDYSMRREYFRLIVYMCTEMLVKAMNQCLITIQNEVTAKDRSGLFIIMPSFKATNNPNELMLDIGIDVSVVIGHFDTIIKNVIDDLKETLNTIATASLDSNKSDFIGRTSSNIPDLESIIKESEIYKSVKKKISEKINNDFVETRKFVEKYESCKPIMIEIKGGFDIKKWMEEEHTFGEIEEKIFRWKKYRNTKEKDIKDEGIGIFFVSSKTAREDMNDDINNNITQFVLKLKQFYNEKADELIKELKRMNNSLEVKEFTNLNQYTTYIKNLDEFTQRKEPIKSEKQTVRNALKLLKQHKKLEFTEEEKERTIEESFRVFEEEKLPAASAAIENAREDMGADLDAKKENLKAEVTETVEELNAEQLVTISNDENGSIESSIVAAVDKLDRIQDQIKSFKKNAERYEEYSKLMKKDKKDPYTQAMKTLNDRFVERDRLWRNLKTYEEMKKVWYTGEFLRMDIDEVEKTFSQFETDSFNAQSKILMLVKEKGQKDPVLQEFQQRVIYMKGWMPIISALGNKNLNESHWREIFEKLREPANYKSNRSFSLKNLEDDDIMNHRETIENVSARASGEAKIQADLNEIKRKWTEDIQFDVEPYNDSTDKFILSKTDEIFTLLDDDQSKIQSMLAMKYVVNIRNQVEEWESKLAQVQTTLEEWLDCQRQWMYLENIFGAEDIRRELTRESQRFDVVNELWKGIMQLTNQKPNVVERAANKELCEQFQDNNKTLEQLQKQLEDYLDKKRRLFPRFYFLTNDQLIEILSQTRNPAAVQPHLEKCFDNIKRIEFLEGQDSVDIIAMQSADPEADPEKVQFSEIVKATGLVEGWLKRIEEMMVRSLYDKTKETLKAAPGKGEKRAKWFFSFPAQSILVVDMIMWTSLMEDAILAYGQGSKDALSESLEVIKSNIQEMVDLVKTDLTIAERETIKSLIVLEVHNRDVSTTVNDQKVNTINNFEWAKQLRYYWEMEENDCFARQTNTKFRYGYEYLGNGTRLVITPLTDKCYMTLTGALHLHYGGAPEGPAGTGKTETTKDLAKALAIQCIVFNCQGTLDYQTMGRFFSGLAQCGAWACFDEFNRINIEVLSVIAQQIMIIQTGIRNGSDEIEFEEKMIPLNHRFGVFITMNPGYAGRTELPDNLKALFRPVAMMIPDYALIAEIILFSEGFASAKNLSRKMVYLYKLSSEQVSKQKHYDFGMRAVKSVLVMAGALRRKVPKEEEDSRDPIDLESEVLLKAMRDSNVPKFLEQDLKLFYKIIEDLFPGKDVPQDPHEEVKNAIYEDLEKNCLQKPDSFITKIIQLLETMLVRHGVMTVGETGSGKSTITNTLAAALTELGKNEEYSDPWYTKIKKIVLNPKSITEQELFGVNDIYTNTFTHGIVSKLITQALEENESHEKKPVKKWVWFDGPVDAGWIENMNTVLDDNKMLCLPDGKRIKLPSTFTMLFEVQDLLVASPATVSRCGMVFLEKSNLGIQPIIDTWRIRLLKSEEEEYLEKEKQKELTKAGTDKKAKKDATDEKKEFVPPSYLLKVFEVINDTILSNLKHFRKAYKEEIPSVDVNIVQSCLSLFEALYREHKEIESAKGRKKMLDQDREQLLINIFIFSYYWSLGGNIDDKSREKFNKDMKEYFSSVVTGLPRDVFNFYIDLSSRKWEDWNKKQEKFKYDPEVPYFRILVETPDTVRYTYLLKTINSAHHNVLLMGRGGVGKSSIVKDYLFKLNKDEFVFTTTTFSAQTNSSNIQSLLIDKLQPKAKYLAPPGGKKMILHFDDINMPKLDIYGAQPPNELLRQLIDQGGFYDLKKYTFKPIKDCYMVASCSPPGGGRNPVTPRLFRHFHMLWMQDLSDSSMETIFKSILEGYLSDSRNTETYTSTAGELVSGSVKIYKMVKEKLLPTPSKSHYTFNLRDLSKVIQGMLQMSQERFNSRDDLIKLWVHEESRIFHDRLVNEKDRTVFYDILLETLEEATAKKITREEADNVIFSDMIDLSYQEVTDKNELLEKAQLFCEKEAKESKKKLELVFFDDALKHLCRIARIIKQPRGNCLLIGVGGSGRQSLTRIARSVYNYGFYMIEISKNYKEQTWRDNIAELLKKVGGGKGENRFVFLFSDTHILYESFLEDINNILNTGEIPNLWKPEDIEAITSELRPLAASLKRDDSKDSLMELFVHLVRENLHICLTFSPVGDKLRERCRQFPSIIDCCTIDWFDRWPTEALQQVALSQLKKLNDPVLEENVDVLSDIVVNIHNDVIDNSELFFEELRRKYYITPTSYLELLQVYLDMYISQKNMIPILVKKYAGGLQKLKETNEQVKILQEKIIQFQPILDKKQAENEKLKADLEIQNAEAQKVEKVVSKDAEEAQKTRNEVNKKKEQCEEEIERAKPTLEAAKKAAEELDSKDITEIKGALKPVETFKKVIMATALIFDVPENWESAKKFMSNMECLKKLRTLDPIRHVPEKVWKKLRRDYLDQPYFDKKVLEGVSKALVTLGSFLENSEKYYYCQLEFEPKVIELEEAQKNLAAVEDDLAKKMSQLKEIQEKTAELNQKLQDSVTQAQNYETEQKQAKERLKRAEQLVAGLGDESVRWKEIEQKLNNDLYNLIGNTLYTSAIISYLGPFTAPFRKKLMKKWMDLIMKNKIPVTEGFSLNSIIDPIKLREWQNEGLPADELSVENGIIMTKCKRWPLMIDPQSQANKWIKNSRKDFGLVVVKLSNPNFARIMQSAIMSGGSLLIENVEETLDPNLEPVLLRQEVKEGKSYKIKIGTEEIQYSTDFRLYITTKMPNPHYVPEIVIKVTLINFTVTIEGLEDQLLIDVIKQERNELETLRDSLVVKISDYNKQLLDMQEKILKQINESTTNFLDTNDFIDTLEGSKNISQTINKGMKEAKDTAEEINTTREEYRPIAQRGSILYFVIADLANIDPMYQYSLEFFIRLFNKRLKESEKSEAVKARIDIVIKDITEAFYNNICRGLFEKHKLMYSFLMAANIARADKKISDNEWAFFNTGSSGDNKFDHKDKPDHVESGLWSAIKDLERISPILFGITDSMLNPNEADSWKNIIGSDDPLQFDLPPSVSAVTSITHFQKMLVYYTLSKEKLILMVKDFVKNYLGKHFIESPHFNLNASFNDSSENTPIIFVLSPGADPMANLMSFATEKGMDGSRFKMLSLGQGQGKKAEELIKSGRINGDWICLQNCHLAETWMTDLERIQENQGDVLPDYRLWLTSMPSNKFPVSVLQSGIKITNEPPRGIKANLKGSYLETNEDWYNKSSKPEAFKKLLFSLSLFHAVILERRKFGAIGWNIPYGWMNSDLETCRLQIKMYLEEQDDIPYDTLSFLVSVINYGGRVTDNKDEILIRAILNLYFTPDVMTPGYSFSPSGIYTVPDDLSLEGVKSYIEELPLEDNPEIFGLHSNANITYQINQVKEFMETLIMVQPKGSARGKGGETPEQYVRNVAVDLKASLPGAIQNKPLGDDPKSLHIFRAQEIDRFNKLLKVIKKSIDELIDAIDGLAVMSLELENMFNNILIKKVPANWETHGYLSLKPLGSWYKDLGQRVDFMTNWVIEDQLPSYWISCFYFPQGFMTAVLQTYARKMKIPIDELVFETKVLNSYSEQMTNIPEDGVNIHGMYLQGCAWSLDKETLEESEKRKLFQLMPSIYILPIKLSTYDPSGTYACPVYKTSLRKGELLTTGHSTNFVLFLDLPSKELASHWVRRGVALLLQTDD